jgi:hypothetical protein
MPPGRPARAPTTHAPRPGRHDGGTGRGVVLDLDMPRMACVEVVALLSINDE